MIPDVSIIVPIYNGEKYIEDCVRCLLEQTHQNIECILVDDGSRDRTPEMCDYFASLDGRIKVIHQENKGLSMTRNAGIEAATGKYVYFFDVDDKIDSNLVADNYGLAVENNADLVLFGFRYYNVDEDRFVERPLPHRFVGTAQEFFEQYLIQTIDHEVFNAPWNKMIKRELFENSQLRFDTRYPIYEDIIFAALLLQKTGKIVVNHKMYYDYYLKSTGSLLTKFFDNFFDSVSQFYHNAMEYCNLYDNNENQVRRFQKLYSDLTVMHLKQISCQQSLSRNRKYELIERICKDRIFLDAIEQVDYSNNLKKRVVRKLINQGCIGGIYFYYRYLSGKS